MIVSTLGCSILSQLTFDMLIYIKFTRIDGSHLCTIDVQHQILVLMRVQTLTVPIATIAQRNRLCVYKKYLEASQEYLPTCQALSKLRLQMSSNNPTGHAPRNADAI
jgi:hypothetical protein